MSGVGPTLWGVSSLGLAAAVIGAGLSHRVWLAINKSGHLDRKKKD
jgi:hypothetical protein